MALCPKCGSQVAEGVKSCGVCGAPLGVEASSPVSTSPPTSPGGQGGMTPNVAAMLTYVPICLVGFICAILFGFVIDPHKRDPFVKFHAIQSLAIHVIVIVFNICAFIFSLILAFIPFIHFFSFLIYPVLLLVMLGVLILMIVLMIKSYGNETFKVPLLGDWAEEMANK
jgi:uncharacterized membrane protein